jgi:hypothetical protein|tara:strand:- start:921 stop:1220 length:300 start_codon:yes stop_codon:yes gene_type:complete
MTQYNDDDLVYVDPQKREVISLVKWDKDGNAIPLEKEEVEEKEEDGKKKRKKKYKSYYPWGTYKTMKKIYKLEGKAKEDSANQPFDEAFTKATKEVFWD